jgi:ribonuclease BN (tRNA processing enzyme)
LLDDDVLIDAGTGVGDLTLDEMVRIDHVLVSHSHLDHVLAIALLADSVMRRRTAAGRPPIRVHALPETIAALRAHVFNGVIWPDFTKLPSAEKPILDFSPLACGDTLQFGERHIEVLPAEHTVPAVGFAVMHPAPRGGAAWVFTGDTGPNPALWARLRGLAIDHLVIETAFGDDEHVLADLSRHLCPQTLGIELAQLAGSVRVHITHIKPGEVEPVMAQVRALGSDHRIHALATGQLIDLD